MTRGQKAQSKAAQLLNMLAHFAGLNGSDPNCAAIAIAACELSTLLEDEVLIFEDEEEGGYDYCTGRSYHGGWDQMLLDDQVVFSSVEGWY